MISIQTTTETRLHFGPEDFELKSYLENFITEYNMVKRLMFREYTSSGFAAKYGPGKMSLCESRLKTDFQNRFGLLRRTVNSMLYEIKGLINSQLELKKIYLKDVKDKMEAIEKQILCLEEEISELKPSVLNNTISDKKMQRYRNIKTSIYAKKNKLEKLKAKEKRLKYELDNKIVKIGFGSRKMFKKQYNLEENHYKDHAAWYKDYVKCRDSNIFFVGCKDEVQGCDLLQLYHMDENTYYLKFRKQNKDCIKKSGESCFITKPFIGFDFLSEELAEILNNHINGKKEKPLTYRIKRKGNKWYLQVMFELNSSPCMTSLHDGAVGLDYNEGFIELTETDNKGNIVNQKHYELSEHGKGNKAENEIRNTIKEICNYCLRTGKSLAIEDLDFLKKKRKIVPAKSKSGKRYNRMLHLMDYKRYKETAERGCIKYGVDLIKVNPAYTSKIGKEKYAGIRKMTVHKAASYVIARRAQGFEDRLKA